MHLSFICRHAKCSHSTGDYICILSFSMCSIGICFVLVAWLIFCDVCCDTLFDVDKNNKRFLNLTRMTI